MQRLFFYFSLWGWLWVVPYLLQAQTFEKPQLQAAQEVWEYAQKNIFPIVQAQRKQLELYLQPEDKIVIEQLRKQMQMVTQEMKKYHKGYFQRKKQRATPTLSLEQKQELAKAIISRMDIIQQAHSIAQKYQAQINAQLAPVRQHQESWKKDLRAIYQKYAPELSDSLRQGHNQFNQKGKKIYLQSVVIDMLKKSSMPVGFLLLNPEESPIQKLQDLFQELYTNQKQKQEQDSLLRIYPNPVKDISVVEYTLQQTGQVSINLLDLQGNLIKNLWSGEQAAGVHRQEFSLKELNQGIYLYQMVLPKHTITQRIIKD